MTTADRPIPPDLVFWITVLTFVLAISIVGAIVL
jgi:hypothetical protein